MSEQLANDALPVVREDYNVVADSIHLGQQKPDYKSDVSGGRHWHVNLVSLFAELLSTYLFNHNSCSKLCPGMATCLMQFHAKMKVAMHSEGKNIIVANFIASQLSVTQVTCITCSPT